MKNIYKKIFISIFIISISISFVHADTIGTSSGLSRLKLKGTLFTGSLNPLVVLEDTETGKISMYEIGDTVDAGLKISFITRGEVTFKQSDNEYKLSLPTGGVWQPQPFESDEDAWYNIQRQGNNFKVDDATVSGAFDRTREIMSNVKIAPHYKDGKKYGLKVTKLTPVGILKEVGVKEGDIIKSINGFKIHSPHQIFRAYRRLKNQKHLNIDIIRNESLLVLTYQIGS